MGLFPSLRRARQERKARKAKSKADGDILSLTASSSNYEPTGSFPDSTFATRTLGQARSSAVHVQIPRHSSPGTSIVPIIPDDSPFRPTDQLDLWTWAYNELFKRERELMENYMKHLTSLQNNDALGMDNSASWSVESVVKHLMDNREKKQWSVSLFGKEVKLREYSERLAKFLLWTEPIVKTAANAHPCAALAWSSVSLLLPLLTSSTTANEAMLKGFNTICKLQLYWKIFEDRYFGLSRGEKYKDLREPLIKLYSHIVEYQARIICYLASRQLHRAGNNIFGWNNWSGLEADIIQDSEDCRLCVMPIEAEECRINRDCQLQEMVGSRQILDEIRMILNTNGRQQQIIYEDQKEKDLLQDLASNYEDQKNYNPLKVAGTCEWFIADRQFREWRDSNSSSLLWVTAGPGCGKSVLSRALVDEQQLSTRITTSTVCYFFFKDGEECRIHATDALCAILHQLFTSDPTGTLIRHGVPKHRNHGKSLTNNLSQLWQILLDCSPEAGEIVCVLDALDECDGRDWPELIHKLEQFYSNPKEYANSKIKILITSRPYDNLESSFKELSHTSVFMRFDGDDKSAQISQDINLVIDAQMGKIASDFNEDDQRRISDQLKSMEHRTYLWLYLTFDIIKKSPSEYSRSSDMEALLSNLPTKVSEAYEKILDRSKETKETETLLQIMLCAVRPLTLNEANAALTLVTKTQPINSHADMKSQMWGENVFKTKVKNLCGLFVSVYDSKLSFLHLTAREFLIDPERKGRWQGRLTMFNAHKTMALICLEYLTLLDDANVVRELMPEFPLASYSTEYWMDHVRPVTSLEEVRAKTLDFFLQHPRAYTAWSNLFECQGPYFADLWFAGLSTPNPLYYSSLLGLYFAVQTLILEKADVNAWTRVGTPLEAASLKGHVEIARLLLDNGANMNTGGIFDTALHCASCRGQKEIILLLLAKGADVDTPGSDSTPLGIASAQGYREIIQLLLDSGADTNRSGCSSTALQCASLEGHKEIVQLLLDNGTNINTRGKFETALQSATLRGHKEIVQLLLEKGANINECEYGDTPLTMASFHGYEEIVQLLLAKGANINKRGSDDTPLTSAVIGGHTQVVELLLEKGAYVDENALARSVFGYTASGSLEQKDIITLLLENGADVNAAGKWGTALQAASINNHKQTVSLLLERDADINAKGYVIDYVRVSRLLNKDTHSASELSPATLYHGDRTSHPYSALQIACFAGHNEIVQLLLDKNADVNTQDTVSCSALQIACHRENKEILHLILEKGADVNEKGILPNRRLIHCLFEKKHSIELLFGKDSRVDDEDACTCSALQVACLTQRRDIAQILLETGADVNAAEGLLCSALQMASLTKSKDIIQLLLDKGADVNARGTCSYTPLQIAYELDSKEIIQLLLEHGACYETVP